VEVKKHKRAKRCPKGSRKNNLTFYTSPIQITIAPSEDTKSSKELAIPPVLHLQIEQI
jgi:hypothetical protein